MKKLTLLLISILVTSFHFACLKKRPEGVSTQVETATGTITLPPAYQTKSTFRFSKATGWPENQRPTAPPGFEVTEFARDLQSPRWIYVAPNGDVFVAEANTEPKGFKKILYTVVGQTQSQPSGESANRITVFRDTNQDGQPDQRQVFLEKLNQPFGMAVLGNSFYVANTDGLLRFPYQPGQTKITAQGTKILDLPAGGYNNHWTRNILVHPNGTKLFISVGSASNVGEHGMEHEVRRANILEINPDGSGERIFASGLRNPVGMDWLPGTTELWTAVNERDELGDNLVPDYLASVQEGAFYGWPYAYFGMNEDPRRKGERPDLVAKTKVPEVPLGAHTASLGFTFYNKTAFPVKYHKGAFVGQHGSWNRSSFSGYKVVFVPFQNGKPSGPPEDFLTGFIANPTEEDREVYGRPVGVAVLPDGSIIVADDAGHRIWRVRAK